MPIPPVPQTHPSTLRESRSRFKKNTAWKSKSKSRREGDKERVRPVISAPVLQGPGPKMATRPIIPQIGTQPMISGSDPILQDSASTASQMTQNGSTPIMTTPVAQGSSHSQTNMLDSSDGSRRQSTTTPPVNSMDRVTEQFRALQAMANSQNVENANAAKKLRLSPLQRGKAILKKATRAFSGLGPKANEVSPARLNLHRAEGVNLLNEKVQTCVDDGHVKRKPIPDKKPPPPPEVEAPEVIAYKDAWLEFLLTNPTKEDFIRTRFEFNLSEAKLNSINEAFEARRHSGMSMAIAAGSSQAESGSLFVQANPHLSSDEFAESEQSISSSRAYTQPVVPFRFRRNVSGLAQQHAEHRGEDVPAFVATPSGPSTHDNKRAKRRSAIFEHDDVVNSDDVKRTKRDSLEFRHEGSSASLTAGPKRDLAMSDVAKGKQPMTGEEVGRPQLPQRRGAVHRRSAIPRPTANLYRGGVRARGAFDMKVNNPMGVNDSELSDRADQVGEK